MEKDQITTGLSRDFIIHPGETLQEVLEDRGMSQKELAIRTGMTEKHVSTIIHGLKPVSVAFAKRLEYALGIEAAFWIQLQANYDRELLEFEELNHITQEELSIIKNLKEVIEYFCERGWMNKDDNSSVKVLELRKLLNISNLSDITGLVYNAAFRAQIKNNKIDPYVLFAWQRMCELLVQDIKVASRVDIEKLRKLIPEIKNTMFLRANSIQRRLEEIFAECGIAFKIVKNFKGAPVQGFIKTADNKRVVLCITIRQSYADIFWFTLFHEIAHIINGDMKNRFVDFDSVSNELEARADKFASNILIPKKDYKKFTDKGDFSFKAITDFAGICEVQPFIVIGRLMKDGKIDWTLYSKERLRYKWT